MINFCIATLDIWQSLTSKVLFGAATKQGDQNPFAVVVGEASGITNMGGSGQGDDGEDELHVDG